ncbi:hypothetical protein HPB49_021944 [Dermacentor silvarum]|uniref:Uncharacterized protein n=1 Tax=Dermacentor silvarum TaxID=543639 RepID=A0ACB8D882_DERSI|nr:hypothetical protein HPB49_021944 [Dermacentor silvarum]
MVGVLRLCPAVALLVVAFAADSDLTGSTKDFQTLAARLEEKCLKKVGMTPEEISTQQELEFLDYVDLYARTPETSKGIRSKWEAFMYLDYLGLHSVSKHFEEECLARSKPIQESFASYRNERTQKVQKELLSYFDEGKQAQFFAIWDSVVSRSTAIAETMCHDLEFHLRLHFAVYPLRYPEKANLQGSMTVEGAMSNFRQYIESIKARTEDPLVYFALPYVQNPRQFPVFKPVFEAKGYYENVCRLDFSKIKQDLSEASASTRALLLQALRWGLEASLQKAKLLSSPDVRHQVDQVCERLLSSDANVDDGIVDSLSEDDEDDEDSQEESEPEPELDMDDIVQALPHQMYGDQLLKVFYEEENQDTVSQRALTVSRLEESSPDQSLEETTVNAPETSQSDEIDCSQATHTEAVEFTAPPVDEQASELVKQLTGEEKTVVAAAGQTAPPSDKVNGLK